METFVMNGPEGNSPKKPAPLAQQPAEQIPERVKFAFNFIAMCNQEMGTQLMIDPVSGASEQIVHDLHPKQEQVLGLACNVVGEYFGAKEG